MIKYIKYLVAAFIFAAGYKVGNTFKENTCNKQISELKDKELQNLNKNINVKKNQEKIILAKPVDSTTRIKRMQYLWEEESK